MTSWVEVQAPYPCQDPSPLAIIGCGWLGREIAFARVTQGGPCVAVTPRPFENPFDGLTLVNWSWPHHSSDSLAQKITGCRKVVVSLPFRRQPKAITVYPQMMRACWQALKKIGVEKVVMFSSTAVYPSRPQPQDETSLTSRPQESRAAILWDCERMFLEEPSWHACVLRLGGLYGPGRPLRRLFERDADRFRPNRVFNLVHRDDVVRVVGRLLDFEGPSDVFNVVADEHPTFAQLCAIMENRCRLSERTAAPKEGKIVLAEKVKRLLRLTWLHPKPSEDLRREVTG